MPEPAYVASPNQVSCDLAGEAAILNLKSGTYYGLDPVGASIWRHLATPRTIPELRDLVMQEYDVDQATCERDLRVLLADLLTHGLVSESLP